MDHDRFGAKVTGRRDRRDSYGGVTAGAALRGFAAVALATVALVAASKSYTGARPNHDDPYDRLSRFGAVFDLVREKYVDKPNEAKLIEAALKGMVASLDPHSGYVSGQAYRALQSRINGELGDVGLAIVERGDIPTVAGVIDGTSAARAGFLPGDRIEAIDGEATRGFTADHAVERMRGAVDTSVRLTVGRGTGGTVKEFEILRDVVRIKSVRSHVEGGDVGYIRVDQFTDPTASGLEAAMARLRAEIPSAAFKGYILDLRNNPGGLFDQAIETVNAFVDKGEIVATRGRAYGADKVVYARPGADLSGGKPLVVLINGGTASAAEIVAGALQDLGRATLIGTRSFGKGSIQSTIPLGDGALHLTTALYFTPSGRSIQARGVDPDIEILQDVPDEAKGEFGGGGEASLERHLRNEHGERPGSQSYAPPNPLDDKQLIAAVDFLHGAGRDWRLP